MSSMASTPSEAAATRRDSQTLRGASSTPRSPSRARKTQRQMTRQLSHADREMQKREKRKERLRSRLRELEAEEEQEAALSSDGGGGGEGPSSKVPKTPRGGGRGSNKAMHKLKSIMPHPSKKTRKRRYKKLLQKLEAIKDERLEEEIEAVKEFRSQLDEKGLLETNLDDYHTFLRFLKARKFDFEKTMEMWSNHLQWRRDFGTDHILDFEFPELADVKRHYPHGHHGVDRDGRPIYIELVGQVDTSKVLQFTTIERFTQYHVKEFERTFKFKFPACSVAAQRHIDQTTSILDVAGMGMRNFSKDARDVLGAISKIDSDNYPETLHRLFIINAGMAFRSIWSVVKGMLDPKTASKILVLGTNYQEKVFEAIDPSQLPEIVGGACKCEGVEGGCLMSDKGPWHDEELLRAVKLQRYGTLSDRDSGDDGRRYKFVWGSGSYKLDGDYPTDTESDAGSDIDEGHTPGMSLTNQDFDKLLGDDKLLNRNKGVTLDMPSPMTIADRLRNPKSFKDGLPGKNDFPSKLPQPSHYGSSNASSDEDESLDQSRELLASTSKPPPPADRFAPKASSASSSTTKKPPTPKIEAPPRNVYSPVPIPHPSAKDQAGLINMLISFFGIVANIPFLFTRVMARTATPALPPASFSGSGRGSAYANPMEPPIPEHIMRRVQELEAQVERLTSGPATPLRAASPPMPDWPEPALQRVNALELELAETKKELRLIVDKQDELINLIQSLKSKRRMSCFG